jgi:hypothetical protein
MHMHARSSPLHRRRKKWSHHRYKASLGLRIAAAVAAVAVAAAVAAAVAVAAAAMSMLLAAPAVVGVVFTNSCRPLPYSTPTKAGLQSEQNETNKTETYETTYN